MVGLGWAVWAACTPEQPLSLPLPPGPVDDARPPGSTPSSTSSTTLPPRPLCVEPAPPPVVAADLQRWIDETTASDDRYFGRAELDALDAMGEDLGATDAEIVSNRILRGWNRLRFGDVTGAIADLDAAEALADTSVPELRGRARELLGAAWIRKAETDNCLSGAGEACIVPFDPNAIHADPTGMANAGAAFERCLTDDLPDALSVQWLLNVTYMARGDWPGGVPEAWRFPAGFLDAEATSAAWTNHVPMLALRTAASLAGGSAIDDFDGDGRLDLMLSAMGPGDGMRLYLNVGDGSFCDASDASGVSSIPSILSFQPADYDNDGDLDVFAPRAAWHAEHGSVRPSLLRNDGAGHFVDVAIDAGVADPAVDGPSQVGVWADFDGDGALDLFVGREDPPLPTMPGQWVSSLYHNRGDGTFVDLGRELGVSDASFAKGASAFDLEGDGDLDLFVSAIQGPDHLFVNQGDLGFVDRAAELGTVNPRKSFGTIAFDYDQDGLDDLFVAAFTTSYGGGSPLAANDFRSTESFVLDKLGLPTDPAFSETARLYHNVGGAFEDVTEAVGLDDVHATMGLSFGDMDLDGFPDLYLATGAPDYDALEPNTAYRNDGGARFLDVTTDARLGHLQKGHGASFGDVDEDGDEDLLVDIGGAFVGDPAPPALWSNPTNGEVAGRHAVTLRLEGVTCNRDAVGARVAVVTPGRTFRAVVGQTGSFGGNSRQLELGLGDEDVVDHLEIRWPDGIDEVVEGVSVDGVSRIRQGDGVVAWSPYRRIVLPGAHADGP